MGTFPQLPSADQRRHRADQSAAVGGAARDRASGQMEGVACAVCSRGNSHVKQWNATLARKPSAAAPIAARLLQRKCACGNHTAGGECTPCAKQQAGKLNLVVNTPGDADEREADQVADRIMETADGDVPRSAPVAVRGHAVAVARETNAAPPTVQQTLSSPGRPLDASARLRME